MSEHSVTIVRLGRIDETAAAFALDAARRWLLDREIITVNTKTDELQHPSAWAPGAEFAAAVKPGPWLSGFLATANNGVDFTASWEAFHPAGNDEPPACRQCSTPAEGAYGKTYSDWATRWFEQRIEPVFTCHACGWSGPAGGWIGEFSLLIGAPAVTFNNWPNLHADVTSVLRDLLGGRTGLVRCHL